MAPARDLIDVTSWGLSSSYREKSRSHLALFETVDRERAHRHRQTEHHNAFGYLGQSIFSRTKTPVVSSASCHQLPNQVRGSPESLFSRLSEAKPANTNAGRNESSAIFAVMGQGEQPPHSPTNGQLSRSPGQRSALSSSLSEEKVILSSPQRHQSPSGSSPDNSLSPLHFTVSRPSTAFDDYQQQSKHRTNQHQYQHQYPQTSTPLGHLHRYHSKSVFSVPFSAMTIKVSITVVCLNGAFISKWS